MLKSRFLLRGIKRDVLFLSWLYPRFPKYNYTAPPLIIEGTNRQVNKALRFL